MTERNNLLLGVVVSLYLVLGLSYSFLIPVWEAPDESDHYHRALSTAREDLAQGPGEALQPPLYYWLASVPLRILDQVDREFADFYTPPKRAGRMPRWAWNSRNHRFLIGPHVLRWINLLLGAVTILLVYRAARRFVPESATVALVASSLVGLLPQFLIISASVSNDPLANLAGAFLFWLLSRISSSSVQPREGLWIVFAAVLLPLLTKLTVAPPALAVIVAVIWSKRADLRTHWPWLVGVALLLLLAAMIALQSAEGSQLLNTIRLRLSYFRPDAMEAIPKSALGFAITYWGALGHNNVFFPTPLVLWLTALGGFGCIASFRLLFPENEATSRWQKMLGMGGCIALIATAAFVNTWVATSAISVFLVLLYLSLRRRNRIVTAWTQRWAVVWVVVGLAFLAVARNSLATAASQGRHIFPSIGELSLLMASGWFLLLPEWIGRFLPLLIIPLLLALNAFLIFAGAIPVYYQWFLD